MPDGSSGATESSGQEGNVKIAPKSKIKYKKFRVRVIHEMCVFFLGSTSGGGGSGGGGSGSSSPSE